MDATDEGARATVGVGGDAAGVYYDNTCSSEAFSRVEAALAQSRRNRLAVGTAGAASEVLDMVFCHVV